MKIHLGRVYFLKSDSALCVIETSTVAVSRGKNANDLRARTSGQSLRGTTS